MAWDGLATGGLSTGLNFFVGAPNILSAIKSGENIEINGTNLHFGSDPTITLGGNPLTVLGIDVNGERVTVEIPQTILSGAYNLTLENPNGSANIDVNFIFGGALGLVLRDGNGNIVGELEELIPPNTVQVRIPITMSNGTKTQFKMRLSENDGILSGNANSLSFSTPNCSGVPYGPIQTIFNQPFIDFPEFYAENNYLGYPIQGPIKIYVPTFETGSDVTINSRLVANEVNSSPPTCQAAGPYTCSNCVPLELVFPDILQTFPPPYTLEKQ